MTFPPTEFPDEGFGVVTVTVPTLFLVDSSPAFASIIFPGIVSGGLDGTVMQEAITAAVTAYLDRLSEEVNVSGAEIQSFQYTGNFNANPE